MWECSLDTGFVPPSSKLGESIRTGLKQSNNGVALGLFPKTGIRGSPRTVLSTSTTPAPRGGVPNFPDLEPKLTADGRLSFSVAPQKIAGSDSISERSNQFNSLASTRSLRDR